ncbi:MAG: hypothetical protein H6713_12100 [Myxococcales bacterium]|nr:hypothetical protein [Myxococcales bacterium]
MLVGLERARRACPRLLAHAPRLRAHVELAVEPSVLVGPEPVHACARALAHVELAVEPGVLVGDRHIC